MGLDVVQDILRTIAFFLDDKVYGLISQVYELFMYLSQINLLSGDNNPLNQLISRVYVLLGIFMLFKLSFSLLQYMVDPNSFSDSAKGFGKLVTNSLVSLSLLILVPFIFSAGMELQSVILNENIIPNLILGSGIKAGDSETSTGSSMNVEFVQELAKDTQFMMFGTFYYVDQSVMTSCDKSPVFGTIGMATDRDCLEDLEAGFAQEEAIYSSNVQLTDFFKTSDGTEVNDRRNFSHFDKLLWWKINGNYVIKYIPFISTAAGVYVLFMLISFCIEVAVRILKLAFLQATAPIAIISYMDPKESLSNSKLSNWLKETGKTYFSLFLRLAIIYLILLFISVISDTVLASDSVLSQQIGEANQTYSMWIYLFLIIGAFMFAKRVPELIEKIFGIKGTGEFNLNPFKNFANVRDSGFGALAGGAIGLGVGAAASGMAAFSATRDEGGNIGKALFRGAGGTLGGALRGTKVGFQSGGKQTLSKAFDVAGIAGRNAALKTNTKFSQRLGAQARMAVGMQSKKEGLDKRIGYHEDLNKHAASMKDRASDQLSKKSDNWKWIQQERANLQEAVKNNRDIQYTDDTGRRITVSANDKDAYREAFNKEMDRFHKNEEVLIKNYVNSGGKSDGTKEINEDGDYQIAIERSAFIKEYKDNKLHYTDEDGNPIKSKVTGQTMVVDENIQWEDIDTLGKAAEREAATIKNDKEYRDAETLHQMQKSGMMQSFFDRGRH